MTRPSPAVYRVTEPLPPAWPFYAPATVAEVSRRVARGDVHAFGDHDAVLALEAWARDYFGTAYALATSSGTTALASAYHALGVGPGDLVVAPAYTFHATVTPLLRLGAVPLLVDCSPADTRLDLADLEVALRRRPRLAVVTHMFGLPDDLDEIVALCATYGVPLVEDASQAHGATYRGRRVGSFGAAGCFSLGGQKPVSGGMGGVLVTDRQDVYERSLVLGHAHERARARVDPAGAHWAETAYGGGENYRIHPLSAVLALEHATTLDERIAVRTAVLGELSALLTRTGVLDPPTTPADRTRGGWYGYKATVGRAWPQLDRDDLVRRLHLRNVKADVPSTRPVQLTFRPDRFQAVGDLRASRALWERTVGLPDKYLHAPAPALLAQYEAALADLHRELAP